MMYYGLVDNVAGFINKYNIDIGCIKESTVNKICEHHKIDALIKADYSEP